MPRRTKKSPPPPLAKPASVTCFLHEPTEITLSVAGRIIEPMELMIRKAPKEGDLGRIQRVDRETFTVIYSPKAAALVGPDSFTFAAKSSDSPVSAAASVRIQLVERPPALEIPGEVDFGSVFLGESSRREILLKNSGGGFATGGLRVNAPWEVDGNEKFAIAGGRTNKIILEFRPIEEREFRDRIILGDEKNVLLVKGRGITPVSWPGEGLVFSPADHLAGESEVVLTNNTPIDRVVSIEWPEFLKSENPVTIPANHSVRIKAKVTADPAFRFDGTVQIESGSFRRDLPVKVYPAPAKIVSLPPEELKLVTNPTDPSQKSAPLVVKNTGGTETSLSVVLPSPLRMTPDPSTMVIRPGEERDFEILLDDNRNTEFSGKLTIQFPSHPSVELKVTAPASQQTDLPTAQALLPLANDFPPSEATPSAAPVADLPQVTKVFLESAEPHEIKISWNLPSLEHQSFQIERRRIRGAKEGVLVDWVPWEGGVLAAHENRMFARLHGLPANTFWVIRIIPIEADGTFGPPSPGFQIATPPVPTLHVPWWGWAMGMIAGGFGIRWFWLRLRKQQLTTTADRIARLEGK